MAAIQSMVARLLRVGARGLLGQRGVTRDHAIGFIYGAGTVTLLWCLAWWLGYA
jgi:hypothetical protein